MTDPFDRFLREGYTMAVEKASGEWVPGVADWAIELFLDLREMEVEFDDCGQAYRVDDAIDGGLSGG